MELVKTVIIVAGGSGKRLGTEVPKQFLELGRKPVLAHSLEKFHHCLPKAKILLVLPEDQFEYWNSLCDKYQIDIPCTLINGGKERFFSVKNALDSLNYDDGLVAIHDAARPFVSNAIISNAFKAAEEYSSAIPAVPVSQSMRMQDGADWVSVDRTKFRLMQTPQVFKLARLKKAYEVEWNANFTDDASVYEYLGDKIHLIEGEDVNIKLTTSADLNWAKWFLEQA